MPNQGVREVKPVEPGKGSKVERGGPGVAPPPFRESNKEFTKRIADLEQGGDKK